MKEQLNDLLENFMDLGEKIHKDQETEELKDVQCLYHFTNAQSFEKIIHNRRLWFSDYRTLNDRLELTYSKDIIHQVLDKSSLPSKEMLCRFINHFFDSIHSTRDKLNVYIACFAKSIHNLALWRFYANDGCGIATGFDPEFILEIGNSIDEEIPKSLKVVYDENIYSQKVNLFLNTAICTLKKAQKSCSSIHKNDDFIQKLHTCLLSQLIPLLPMLKHSSFELEKEYRLYLIDGSMFNIDQYPRGFRFSDERRESYEKNLENLPTLNGVPIMDNTLRKKRWVTYVG